MSYINPDNIWEIRGDEDGTFDVTCVVKHISREPRTIKTRAGRSVTVQTCDLWWLCDLRDVLRWRARPRLFHGFMA